MKNVILDFMEHDNAYIYSIVCYILLAVVILAIASYFIIYYTFKRNVMKHSCSVKELKEVNSQYNFCNSIGEYIRYTYRCNSKQQFDKTNNRMLLQQQVSMNPKYFEELVRLVDVNRLLYIAYKDRVNQISMSVNKSTVYQKLEENIFDAMILHPPLDVSYGVRVLYTSPQGRNRYEREVAYYRKDILESFDQIKENEKRKETKEYQRSLMSNKLRYQIMKRDGFKCLICGKTAEDGAKLEVDHIYPISKGGKTEPNNLRTLCRQCNSGKGSSFDANSLN